MNGKKAKLLRRAATIMAQHGEVDRELVRNSNGVIVNKRGSTRERYLKFKRSFNNPAMKGFRRRD